MAVDEEKILLDWSRKPNWRILKEDAKKIKEKKEKTHNANVVQIDKKLKD